MLAPRAEIGDTEGMHGLPHHGGMEIKSHGRPPEVAEDGLVSSVADFGVTPNKPSSPLPHRTSSHENLQKYRVQEQAYVVDGLDWRQVLQEPLYAAGVVRGIKQALRAGQSVRISSRQTSLGRSDLVDCQLMLRTLYMQCVQVGDKYFREGRIQWRSFVEVVFECSCGYNVRFTRFPFAREVVT